MTKRTAKKPSQHGKLWTTLSIRRETAERLDELARLITESEDRLQECPRYEAMHKAVAEMLRRLKSKINRK